MCLYSFFTVYSIDCVLKTGIVCQNLSLVLLRQMFDEGKNVVTITLNDSRADKTGAMKRPQSIYSFDRYNGWTTLRPWAENTSCGSLNGVSEGVLYPQ